MRTLRPRLPATPGWFRSAIREVFIFVVLMLVLWFVMHEIMGYSAGCIVVKDQTVYTIGEVQWKW